MATKNKGQKKSTMNGEKNATNGTLGLPAGFEELAGSRVAGWFTRVGVADDKLVEELDFEIDAESPTDERAPAGNVIRGILREVFEVKSRFVRDGKAKKKVFKIETTEAGTLIDVPTGSKGDEPNVEVAGAGVLVGLDESGWLKRLTDAPIGSEVFIRCLGLATADDESPQGSWRFQLGINKRSARGTRVNEVTGEVTS